MSTRMWRTGGPEVSVENKKGFFGIKYGNESNSQELDVWLPEGEGVFPAIVLIHGGGFIACDKRQDDMISPFLSALEDGFSVIALNYRLSKEVQFPEPVKDIKQALRFIKANGAEWGVDTEKLVVWGSSAGGYFSLMAALFTDDSEFDNPEDTNISIRPDIKGAVAWYPLTDFQTCDDELKINNVLNTFLREEITDKHHEYSAVFGEPDEGDFPFHDSENSHGKKFLGELPKTAIGKHASPINRIHKNMPKIYIQHGSQDQIIPVQQSIRFSLAANELCGDERVTLEIIPNAIHSSVLFETKENKNKILDFIKSVIN